MSSVKGQGVLNTLMSRFNNFKLSSKITKDDENSLEAQKTAAEYIHKNEMRLRSYSVPSRNNLVVRQFQSHMSHVETYSEPYVFEKVKRKCKPISFDDETTGINENTEQFTGYELYDGRMRPRTLSMPAQNMYQKPRKHILKRSHEDLYNKAAINTDFAEENPLMNNRGITTVQPHHKENNYVSLAAADLYEDEIRARTSSMPTKTTVKKPQTQRLRRSHHDIYVRSVEKIIPVRSFEINRKGEIVKRLESTCMRSSKNVHFEKNDQHFSSDLSRNSSAFPKESNDATGRGAKFYRVFVEGSRSVGKTAFIQRFFTAQYVKGFSSLYGKFLRILIRSYYIYC